MATSKKNKQPTVFTIVANEGTKMVMEAKLPYGAFIKSVRNARNYTDLNTEIGTEGLRMKDIRPLINFLDLPGEKFATLLGVSSRTLSRWNENSPVGVLASKTLLEIDRLTQKGISVFGSPELFKHWLNEPNTSLGDVAPADLLSDPYAVELIDDALGAMEYGNLM